MVGNTDRGADAPLVAERDHGTASGVRGAHGCSEQTKTLGSTACSVEYKRVRMQDEEEHQHTFASSVSPSSLLFFEHF